MKEIKILSMSLLGLKSPNPTVDKEVNAKYIMIMVFYPDEYLSILKY